MPDILGRNITVPGFSPLYPDAHCTEDGDVCQLTTGEGGKCTHDTLECFEHELITLHQRSMQPPQSPP